MRRRAARITGEFGAFGRRLPWVVVVAVLLVLLAAGAGGISERGEVLADSPSLALGSVMPYVVGGMLLIGFASLVAYIAAFARGGPAAKPPNQLLGKVIGAGVALVAAYFVVRNLDRRQDDPAGDHLVRDGAGGGADSQASFWSWQVAVALALVVVVLAVAMFLLLRQASDEEGDRARAETELAKRANAAVVAGRSALDETDDVRLAVINCYTAMEATLVGRGLRRRVTDTPTEFLDRATETGLLSAPAIAATVVLIGLFEQARFSGRPLPPSARWEAESALDRLAAEFERLATDRSEPAPA